jgi:hypothetical protein
LQNNATSLFWANLVTLNSLSLQETKKMIKHLLSDKKLPTDVCNTATSIAGFGNVKFTEMVAR